MSLNNNDMDKDSRLIFEAYVVEGITTEPPGGWQVGNVKEVLDKHYQEIYNNWVPVKRALLTGEIPNYTVFEGKPGERKMDLRDIAPSNTRSNGMVDWIRTGIKQVIRIGGDWADNDTQSNARYIFDPPKHPDSRKENYQYALSHFRKRLVGFGNKPESLWHIIDSRNARELVPAIQRGIDELFDLTREIMHYNRKQTPEDKYPNPGQLPPDEDPNQGEGTGY